MANGNGMTARVHVNGTLTCRYLATSVGVERDRQGFDGYDVLAFWPEDETTWTPEKRASFFRDTVLNDDERAEVYTGLDLIDRPARSAGRGTRRD